MSAPSPTSAWGRFRAWRRGRPFVGGLLLVIAGVEIFLSTQLDLGNIKVQMGIEGFQATLIPILLALMGLLVLAMPAHHVFYGVIALVVAVYSIVGVNLGGFFLGMLLGSVGGILAVAWMPKTAAAPDDPPTGEPVAVAAAAETGPDAPHAEFVPWRPRALATAGKSAFAVSDQLPEEAGARPFARRRR